MKTSHYISEHQVVWVSYATPLQTFLTVILKVCRNLNGKEYLYGIGKNNEPRDFSLYNVWLLLRIPLAGRFFVVFTCATFNVHDLMTFLNFTHLRT